VLDNLFSQSHSQSHSQSQASPVIRGPSGKLETRIYRAKSDGQLLQAGLVAVVCHPHSLHGGSMDNKVATTLARTYRDLGITAITFNFRGVGASEGVFDNAVGEVDDLLAVVNWVLEQCPSARIALAGFSFGSSVVAQGSYRIGNQGVTKVEQLTLVAPPVERYPYAQGNKFPCPVCVIQGGKDELIDVAGVYQWAETLAGEVELIRFDEASHFFHGTLGALKGQLSQVLIEQLNNERLA